MKKENKNEWKRKIKQYVKRSNEIKQLKMIREEEISTIIEANVLKYLLIKNDKVD